MASSKAQNHPTLYTLSIIFLLYSSISIDFVHGARSQLVSVSTIEGACSGDTQGMFKRDSCITALRSNPKIVSSKNSSDLAINIIEAGISSATNTLAQVENLLKGSKDEGLKRCQTGYYSAIASFKSALIEVRDFEEYQTATYDLLIASTDDVLMCSNVTDKMILKGNELVSIYGLSAFQVVDGLF